MQTVKIGELELQIEDHMSLKIEDGGKKITVEGKAPSTAPYYPIWFYPNYIPWVQPLPMITVSGTGTAAQPNTMLFAATDGTYSFSTN